MKRVLIIRPVLLALFALAYVVPSSGTANQEEREPITIGFKETLASEVLEEERELWVHLPGGYETSSQRYPVLLLLDGPAHFHHVTGVTEFLAANSKALPVIVVGIANTQRTRDLTPPTQTPADSTAVGNGGADNFLAFIETELLPHIDATYRTTPYRILVGHSFGGLFAFHALVSRPDLFDAYIAVDPSLWWNNGAPLEQLNQFLEANPDIDKTLFVSDAAGAEHLIDRANEADRRVSNLTNGAMTDYERYATDHAPVGFRWGYARYPSDSHNSVVHQSVYDGLGLVFADMDMLDEELYYLIRDEGLEAVDRYYAKIGERFGTAADAPESLVNRMGYWLMGRDLDKAIAIFERNVKRFPESPNVYDSLGDGYKAKGKMRKALKNYRRAVELAEESGHPSLATYRKNLEQAEEALQKK